MQVAWELSGGLTAADTGADSSIYFLVPSLICRRVIALRPNSAVAGGLSLSRQGLRNPDSFLQHSGKWNREENPDYATWTSILQEVIRHKLQHTTEVMQPGLVFTAYWKGPGFRGKPRDRGLGRSAKRKRREEETATRCVSDALHERAAKNGRLRAQNHKGRPRVARSHYGVGNPTEEEPIRQ